MAPPNTSRLDETFDLLRHPYRRYVLYRLQTSSQPVTIGMLGTEIARWEADDDDTVDTDSRKRVETLLRHTHLPKLADSDVIGVEPTTDHIRLQDAMIVRQFLDQAATVEDGVPIVADD